MKKALVLLLALSLLAALCACAQPAAPAADASDSTDASAAAPAEAASSGSDFSGVTVVASRWAGPNADTQKAIVESYTNGTIVIDDVDYNNLKEKQILSMSASGEYDLIWVPEVWIPEYVANGWLLPLDSYIARDDLNMDDYLSGIVEIGKEIGRAHV